MKHFLLSVIIAAFGTVTAHSQSIKGKLLDLVDNKPLAGATIKLSKLKDTTATVEVLANAEGIFRFDNLSIFSGNKRSY